MSQHEEALHDEDTIEGADAGGDEGLEGADLQQDGESDDLAQAAAANLGEQEVFDGEETVEGSGGTDQGAEVEAAEPQLQDEVAEQAPTETASKTEQEEAIHEDGTADLGTGAHEQEEGGGAEPQLNDEPEQQDDEPAEPAAVDQGVVVVAQEAGVHEEGDAHEETSAQEQKFPEVLASAEPDQDDVHEDASEEGVREDAAEEGVHEGAAEEGVHEGAAEEDVHEGAAEEGVHEGAAEEGVQEDAAEQGVHEGAAEEGVQEDAAEEGVHEEAGEEGVHEGAAKEGVQEDAAEEGVHEEAADKGVHEGAAVVGVQEDAAEEGVHEEAAEENTTHKEAAVEVTKPVASTEPQDEDAHDDAVEEEVHEEPVAEESELPKPTASAEPSTAAAEHHEEEEVVSAPPSPPKPEQKQNAAARGFDESSPLDELIQSVQRQRPLPPGKGDGWHPSLIHDPSQEEVFRLPRRKKGNDSKLRATHPQPSAPTTHQRSQLGLMAESYKRSEPRAVFATEPKFEANRFISKEHSEAILPEWTPGPGTYSSLTWDSKGRVIKGPHGGFYTEPRFHQQTKTYNYYGSMPGPGEYSTDKGYRRLSNKHDLPPVGLPKASRVRFPVKGFELEFYGTLSPGPIYKPRTPPLKEGVKFPKACRPCREGPGSSAEQQQQQQQGSPERQSPTRSPGPACYDVKDTTDSRHRHRGAFSFGAASREKAAMASLPRGQANSVLVCTANLAGPAAYDATVKMEGWRKQPPSVGFPTASRFPPIKSATPGPGSYVV